MFEYDKTRVVTQESILFELPAEILRKIVKFLPWNQQLLLSHVCRGLHSVLFGDPEILRRASSAAFSKLENRIVSANYIFPWQELLIDHTPKGQKSFFKKIREQYLSVCDEFEVSEMVPRNEIRYRTRWRMRNNFGNFNDLKTYSSYVSLSEKKIKYEQGLSVNKGITNNLLYAILEGNEKNKLAYNSIFEIFQFVANGRLKFESNFVQYQTLKSYLTYIDNLFLRAVDKEESILILISQAETFFIDLWSYELFCHFERTFLSYWFCQRTEMGKRLRGETLVYQAFVPIMRHFERRTPEKDLLSDEKYQFKLSLAIKENIADFPQLKSVSEGVWSSVLSAGEEDLDYDPLRREHRIFKGYTDDSKPIFMPFGMIPCKRIFFPGLLKAYTAEELPGVTERVLELLLKLDDDPTLNNVLFVIVDKFLSRIQSPRVIWLLFFKHACWAAYFKFKNSVQEPELARKFEKENVEYLHKLFSHNFIDQSPLMDRLCQDPGDADLSPLSYYRFFKNFRSIKDGDLKPYISGEIYCTLALDYRKRLFQALPENLMVEFFSSLKFINTDLQNIFCEKPHFLARINYNILISMLETPKLLLKGTENKIYAKILTAPQFNSLDAKQWTQLLKYKEAFNAFIDAVPQQHQAAVFQKLNLEQILELHKHYEASSRGTGHQVLSKILRAPYYLNLNGEKWMQLLRSDCVLHALFETISLSPNLSGKTQVGHPKRDDIVFEVPGEAVAVVFQKLTLMQLAELKYHYKMNYPKATVLLSWLDSLFQERFACEITQGTTQLFEMIPKIFSCCSVDIAKPICEIFLFYLFTMAESKELDPQVRAFGKKNLLNFFSGLLRDLSTKDPKVQEFFVVAVEYWAKQSPRLLEEWLQTLPEETVRQHGVLVKHKPLPPPPVTLAPPEPVKKACEEHQPLAAMSVSLTKPAPLVSEVSPETKPRTEDVDSVVYAQQAQRVEESTPLLTDDSLHAEPVKFQVNQSVPPKPSFMPVWFLLLTTALLGISSIVLLVFLLNGFMIASSLAATAGQDHLNLN